MNTLKENNTLASPAMSPATEMEVDGAHENAVIGSKNRPPLKKEELEKIAKQLKKKLSKASITAKQSMSPVSSKVTRSISSSNVGTSPLKNYMLKNILPPSGSPNRLNLLSSSPNQLYSPTGKSPTQMRTSAVSFITSSPRNDKPSAHDLNDSPTRVKSTASSPLKEEPTMILQEITTPSKSSLKPSPPLSANSTGQLKNVQTTPTLPKRQLASSNILKTPTQPKSGNYNDDEGADLLMYLATSPSPAKSYFPNTPRLMGNTSNSNPESTAQFAHISAPNSSFSAHKHNSSTSSANSFIAPPPPLTPKRHISVNARTPQNKLTPSVNLFNNLNVNPSSSGLPSSGLALTPAGFNMNDYVNFFTPSPGAANLGVGNPGRNFLKTPEFNTYLAHSAAGSSALAASHSQNGSNGNQRVDGKMINFDKVGLFKNSETKD